MSETTHLKLALRRLLILAAVALVLAVVAIGTWFAPLFLSPNQYADQPSIEQSRAYRDPVLLRAAWSLPVAARYRRSFEFQHNQSFCGPASVSNVLRSLGRPASQKQVASASSEKTIMGYLVGGLTLDQLGELLSHRTGRPVEIMRNLNLGRFRAAMRLANDPHRRIIVNFHRGPLFGRGHGHFSPVVAYLPDRDLVLIGDVNRAYGPFLVSTPQLWRAANTVDTETKKSRGLALLTI